MNESTGALAALDLSIILDGYFFQPLTVFGIKLVLSVSVLAGMLMKCLACMFIVCLFGLCSMPVRIAAWSFRPLQNRISLLFFLLSLSGSSFRSTRILVIDPEPARVV